MSDDKDILHGDAADESIRETIKEYGWYVALFESDDYLPSFAYTIGLYKTYNHPEIIAFGLSADVLGSLLNVVGESVKSGVKIETNKIYKDFIENSSLQFLPVLKEHYSEYLGYGSAYYGNRDYPVIQMVWPDKEEKYPWEKGFNEDWLYLQKLLDRDPHFKFYESKELGVYTSRFVIDDHLPIKMVCHDSNGDWQFLCGTTTDEKDAKLICLEDMIKRDSSLNKLFDLPYNFCAERNSTDDQWSRFPLEESDDE